MQFHCTMCERVLLLARTLSRACRDDSQGESTRDDSLRSCGFLQRHLRHTRACGRLITQRLQEEDASWWWGGGGMPGRAYHQMEHFNGLLGMDGPSVANPHASIDCPNSHARGWAIPLNGTLLFSQQ